MFLRWRNATARKTIHSETGRRVPQLRLKHEWITKDLPDVRIIPQSLWDKVRAREALVKRHNSPWRGRKAYLPTGMVCCRCGARYTIWDKDKDGRHRMGCSSNRERGKSVCPNGRRVPMDTLEWVIVQAIAEEMLCKDHLQYDHQRCHGPCEAPKLRRIRSTICAIATRPTWRAPACPFKVAQERLGHSTPALTLRIYTHTRGGATRRGRPGGGEPTLSLG